MPGLNFDYTKFLKEQHEKYIQKYGDEPIKAEPNPQPIIGFSGHVPTYRGSLHEMRIVRSMVRCINSPMKPTTATGYRSKSRQFYNPDDERSPRPPTTDPKSEKLTRKQSADNANLPDRVRSAPAALSREKEINKSQPSDISMMAAGSSALLKNDRPKTASITQVHMASTSTRPKNSSISRNSVRSSASSLAPLKVNKPLPIAKHPAGYPQTLYGSSYFYQWPGDTPRASSKEPKKSDTYDMDRRLNRKDGVLYHRHEGMVPKYLGYVPGYKFRHGSTYGVLTVNATSHGLTHRLLAKA